MADAGEENVQGLLPPATEAEQADVPLARQDQEEPAQTPAAQEAGEQARQHQPHAYERRLRQIWELVYGVPPSDDDPDWVLIREATLPVGRDVHLLPRESAATDGFPGNADEVNLLVAAEVERTGRADLPNFIRGRLADTIDRLEAEGASRESITDIALRAVSRLSDQQVRSHLSRRLLAYVVGQKQQTPGYYLTVALLADGIGVEEDDPAELASIVAYHVAMHGFWDIARNEGGMPGRLGSYCSTNAFNLATSIWRREVSSSRPASDGLRLVCQNLLSISAITVAPLPADEELLQRLLPELGIGTEAGVGDPGDVLAVLSRIGSFGTVWSDDPRNQAWIAAAGAVGAGLQDVDLVPARLFNAGVALARAADSSQLAVIKAQLILNLAGLRWAAVVALSTGAPDPDMAEAAWQCARNFCATAEEFRAADRNSDRWRDLEPVIASVLGMSTSTGALSSAGTDLGRARLESAARSLTVTPAPGGDEQMVGLLTQALGILGFSDDDPSPDSFDGRAALILDLAKIVGWTFSDVLGRREWPMADQIRRLGMLRQDAHAQFVTRYEPYTEPVGDPIGQGPLVVAGALSRPQWDDLCNRLLADVPRIAPVLRQEPG